MWNRYTCGARQNHKCNRAVSVTVYKKMNSCLKECNILKIVHDTSDYGGQCSIRAEYVRRNVDGSKSSATEPQFYVVLIYAKSNITEWQLFMRWILPCGLLIIESLVSRILKRTICFKCLRRLLLQLILVKYCSETIFSIIFVYWIHLTSRHQITTWKDKKTQSRFHTYRTPTKRLFRRRKNFKINSKPV